jgi:ornithine carbamoyltransferase
MGELRHFLDLDEVDPAGLRRILDVSAWLKRGTTPPQVTAAPLAGKVLAMVFEKPSTRTRVSFEVAMRKLGGDAIYLDHEETQLGRGETPADTARVLSRYVDAIVVRTSTAARLREMSDHATIPVINGLTDNSHPCQLMADVMTFEERRGPIEGRVVAWSGDGNNVACSWIHAAVQFGFELRIASPPERRPPGELVSWAAGRGGRVSVLGDAEEAVRGADCVVTDAWISMGDEDAVQRHNLLRSYQVDERLMGAAKPDALFMHCLPAHRGEEVTAGVIDGPNSVVWDEAENRLHAQKGILLWCLHAVDEDG